MKKRLNRRGGFWTALIILITATMLFFMGDMIWGRFFVFGGIALIAFWQLIRSRRIYFDEKNLYLKSYLRKDVEIVPLTDVFSFEYTSLRQGASFVYQLGYTFESRNCFRYFIPNYEYKSEFKRLTVGAGQDDF